MRLPQSEFWEMTPREYANACDGYGKKEEEDFKASWERARWIAAVIVNVNSKKQRTPQQLFKFPWDEGSVDVEEEVNKIKAWREQERR